jgi:sugar transport system substrate-binding protein
MKKHSLWFVCGLIFILIITGCTTPTPVPTSAPAEEVAPQPVAVEEVAPQPVAAEKYTIGAILFGRDSFFENIQNGMEMGAEELDVDLLVSIHDHDISKETQFIEDYIARKVDAILITPESLDASVAAIKQAYDAGIKIVCFNTCINETDAAKYVSAFYETDQASLGYQTGEYLAGWLAENMADQEVNVGILQCDRFEACKRRGDGFRQALEDKGVAWNEVANQEGFMPDVGSKVAESILQANPNINILWSENEGGTVGEVIAVRTMGMQDQVFVFGTDISPQLAEMLTADDNVLQAVTGQSPRLMGSDSVRAAVNVLKGETVEYYHVVANAFFSRDDQNAVQQYLKDY